MGRSSPPCSCHHMTDKGQGQILHAYIFGGSSPASLSTGSSALPRLGVAPALPSAVVGEGLTRSVLPLSTSGEGRGRASLPHPYGYMVDKGNRTIPLRASLPTPSPAGPPLSYCPGKEQDPLVCSSAAAAEKRVQFSLLMQSVRGWANSVQPCSLNLQR